MPEKYLNLEKLGKPERCVAGYYFSPIHIPFLLPSYPLPLSTPATQAKFIVVSGRKDGVDLVLIYRYVVIFLARFG